MNICAHYVNICAHINLHLFEVQIYVKRIVAPVPTKLFSNVVFAKFSSVRFNTLHHGYHMEFKRSGVWELVERLEFLRDLNEFYFISQTTEIEYIK